jgi:hypothetical protein
VGLRFRKSFKIAPGVRFNVNKKSVGMSFGVKGARVSINSKGQKTTTVGVPGSGLYYTTTSSVKSQKGYPPSEDTDKKIPKFVGTLPKKILLIKGDKEKYVKTRGFSWLTFLFGPLYFICRSDFMTAFIMLIFDAGFSFMSHPELILVFNLIMAYYSKKIVAIRLIKKGWIPVVPEETINN